MFNDRFTFHTADMNYMNNAMIRIEREGTFSPVLNSRPSRRIQGVHLNLDSFCAANYIKVKVLTERYSVVTRVCLQLWWVTLYVLNYRYRATQTWIQTTARGQLLLCCCTVRYISTSLYW